MKILVLKGTILIILTLLNLFFAFFLWRKRTHMAVFHLSIMAFCSALYSFACGGVNLFWDQRYPYNFQIFWHKFTWVGVLILPAYLNFIYYFTGKTKHIKLKSFFWYSTALMIFCLALTTPYFVKSIETEYDYFHITPGTLEPFGRFYVLLAIILGLTSLIKEYFSRRGFRRLQIKYFILGFIVYNVGGLIFSGILPLIQKKAVYFDITAFFSFFFVVLTYYAIFRYRLMNIQFFLGRTAVYIFTFFAEMAIAFLVIFLNNQLGLFFPNHAIVIITLIIITASFNYFFYFFERMAGKYFYYTFYNLQTTINDLSKKMNQVIKLDELTNLINQSLLNALKLEKIGIVLKDPGKKQFFSQQLIKFNKENILTLCKSENGFLISFIQYLKKPIIREEISFLLKKLAKNKEEKRKLNYLREEMEKNDIALFLPLIIEQEVIGIIILGEKLSGEAYTIEDVNLLNTLTVQLSIAFNNALSYAQIKAKNEELEKILKIVVGRELKMVELKNKIKELEEKFEKPNENF